MRSYFQHNPIIPLNFNAARSETSLIEFCATLYRIIILSGWKELIETSFDLKNELSYSQILSCTPLLAKDTPCREVK
jgi:hypothetical protein